METAREGDVMEYAEFRDALLDYDQIKIFEIVKKHIENHTIDIFGGSIEAIALQHWETLV